jgi:hypothetical protein
VIDPKTDTRSKPATSEQPASTVKATGISTPKDSMLQTRAYELYERRGKVDGDAERDWYQAEAELAGANRGTQQVKTNA